MKLKKLSLMAGLITSLSLCLSVCHVPDVCADEADSEAPIFSDDFEEDMISGWAVLGGVGTMTIDKNTSQSGNASLNITGRTHNFNGPSITLDKYIDEVETYRFSGWVYQEGSETETIKCTLRIADSMNVESWFGVATIEAEPKTWTYFEGTVETPDDIASTLLYFECDNEELEFNIDNISVYGEAPEIPEDAENDKKQTKTSYIFDFETGFSEWISRGDTRLIRTDEQHLSGNYSMYSTNRNKVWNGPTVSIDGIDRGIEYTYETNVFYDDKKADDSHTFLLQVQYSYNGSEVYDFISSAVVPKHEWTKISGPLVVPEGATNVMLYVQTENLDDGVEPGPSDLVSFYIDDTTVLRSDFADTTRAKIITLVVIGLGILVILFLILIIRKASTGKKIAETENNDDKVADVLEVFDAEQNITEKPSENKEENAKDSENKNTKPDSESSPEKKETSENKNSSKNKKASENTENKGKTSGDDSRARDIFNIETFSYEEENTKSDEEDNPLDAPFDGF